MNTRRLTLAAALAVGVIGVSAVAAEWVLRGRFLARASDGLPPPIACDTREVRPRFAAAPVAPAVIALERVSPIAEDEPARDLRLTQGRTVEELLAAAAAGQAGDQLPARLEAILRAEPDAVAPALAFVRSGKADQPVIEALGAAGTPPAQAGLCALASDGSLPPRVRQ